MTARDQRLRTNRSDVDVGRPSTPQCRNPPASTTVTAYEVVPVDQDTGGE